MIPTTTVLEEIRKRKKYRKGPLAEALRVTVPDLNKYIIKGYIQDDDTLAEWSNFLELPDDLEPLKQYNGIYRIFNSLRELWIDSSIADVFAQVVYFRDEIDLNKLRAQILEQTIHQLHRMPYAFSNALSDLKSHEE